MEIDNTFIKNLFHSTIIKVEKGNPIPLGNHFFFVNNGKVSGKMGTKKNVYETLAKVDVSKHVEKKGDATYLSWSWAWAFVKKEFDDMAIKEFNVSGHHTLQNIKWMVKNEWGIAVKHQRLKLKNNINKT